MLVIRDDAATRINLPRFDSALIQHCGKQECWRGSRQTKQPHPEQICDWKEVCACSNSRT